MWPRFNSSPMPYDIWVEYLVGFRLAPRVFLQFLWFSSLKTSTANSNSTKTEDPHKNQLKADFDSSINIVIWCEKWSDQHNTSMEQRNNLSPRQESNPWPPKHCAGTLSTEIWKLMVDGEQGHWTEFMSGRCPAYYLDQGFCPSAITHTIYMYIL